MCGFEYTRLLKTICGKNKKHVLSIFFFEKHGIGDIESLEFGDSKALEILKLEVLRL